MSADPKIINLNLASAQAKVDANARHASARGHLVQVLDHRGNPVKGIYTYPTRQGFYVRPVIDGKQIAPQKLKATTLRTAEIERGDKVAQLAKYHVGLDVNPFATASKTLIDLCQYYLEKNCPGKKINRTRAPHQLEKEIQRVKTIMQWPGAKDRADKLTAESWRNGYAPWRKKQMEASGRIRKGGDRQIDIERSTLSNIFRCAIRNTRETAVTSNPVAVFEFERFRDPALVAHCRDAMPRTGDELHSIARYFFNSHFLRKAVSNKSPRGTKGTRRWQLENQEVFGWVTLFKGRIGHRISALLTLRTDAQNKEQPGFISGKKLYLFRSQTSKGTFGHVDIDRDFQRCIDAHRTWLQLRYPDSCWYFPSPLDPAKPLDATVFAKALARAAKAIGLGHRTPHGLRAFRVNVLRGEGHTLEEAAVRVGHTTLGKLILAVYGEGLDYKLTWQPENDRPAWEEFAVQISPQLELSLGYGCPQADGKTCPEVAALTSLPTKKFPTAPDPAGSSPADPRPVFAKNPTETVPFDTKPD